jgi:outer membrane protein OmpA-like peptidoglycan-associated protein
MFRPSTRRKLLAVTLCALFAAMLGCASTGPNPAVCAAVGGLLGGGGGVAVGASTPDHNSDEQAIYGGAGAILGASTGYLICRAMQKEEAPPPPPAAKPAPKPAPAPAPAPVEEKIVLRGVNFDFDKADIRPDAAVILDEAASILNDNPGRSVSVAGHTDSVGADAYNQGLSERRAAAVKDYLVGKGVDGSRLTTSGFGESSPIAANDTADGRALNRRVELNLE